MIEKNCDTECRICELKFYEIPSKEDMIIE